MDAARPALMLLRVTTEVLDLGVRVAAGDEDAAAQLEAMAGMLGQ